MKNHNFQRTSRSDWLMPPFRKGNQAFTLVELLVSIVIVVALAAIVAVVAGKVRQSAQSANCVSNLRQATLTHVSMAQDNNGGLVHTWKTKAFGSWARNWSQYHTIYTSGNLDWRSDGSDVHAQMRSVETLQCPAAAKERSSEMNGNDSHDGWRTYALNFKIGRVGADDQQAWMDGAQTLTQVENPSRLILFVERAWDGGKYPAGCGASTPAKPGGFFAGHGGRTNVGYLDGHVETLRPENVPIVGATTTGGRVIGPIGEEATSLMWRGRKKPFTRE